MGADVLLQHAAEGRPQVMKSPVKRVDAVTQCVAAKRTYLEKEGVSSCYLLWSVGDLKTIPCNIQWSRTYRQVECLKQLIV